MGWVREIIPLTGWFPYGVVKKTTTPNSRGRQGRQEIFYFDLKKDRPAPAAGSATGCSRNIRKVYAGVEKNFQDRGFFSWRTPGRSFIMIFMNNRRVIFSSNQATPVQFCARRCRTIRLACFLFCVCIFLAGCGNTKKQSRLDFSQTNRHRTFIPYSTPGVTGMDLPRIEPMKLPPEKTNK